MNNLLLDSHILVWWLSGSEKLNDVTANLIDTAMIESRVYVSTASIWELSIKEANGKITLPDDFESVVTDCFNIIPITIDDARNAPTTYTLHKDPFDKMLVAQASWRSMLLVTADDKILSGESPASFFDAR